MNKINTLENSFLATHLVNEDKIDAKNQIIESDVKHDKVLCNHYGRTANNGIRCLGICVADNDY